MKRQGGNWRKIERRQNALGREKERERDGEQEQGEWLTVYGFGVLGPTLHFLLALQVPTGAEDRGL